MRYIFHGRVFPERAYVSINSDGGPLLLELSTGGQSFTLKLKIEYSQISADIETGSTLGIHTLKNVVESVVRTVVDSYGYATIRGYDVEISSCTHEDGNQTVFGVEITRLKEATELRSSFVQTAETAIRHLELRRALSSLRESIRSFEDTGFFSYRAIESVRQYFKTDDDRNGWQGLREKLHVDQSYFDNLLAHATPQRHGEATEMSEDDRIDLMRSAWTIVDRFIVFLNSGESSLDTGEFPTLTSTT